MTTAKPGRTERVRPATARLMLRAVQLVKKVPVRKSIEAGDLRVGFVFPLPVHKLVAETIPPVRTPPGKSSEFQASAALLLGVKKSLRVF